MFNVIANANSIVQHLIKNKNGIVEQVNAYLKITVSAKKIILEILAHVFVRIKSK